MHKKEDAFYDETFLRCNCTAFFIYFFTFKTVSGTLRRHNTLEVVSKNP